MTRAIVAMSLVLSAAVCGCEAPLALGNACSRSSECPRSLVCAYGRCRAECRFAADCSLGARCLVDASGAGRCALVEDERCDADATCEPGLRCAAGECRVPCVAATDCGPEAECDETTGARTCAALACAVSPCRATPPECGCEAGLACYASSAGTTACAVPGPGALLDPCGTSADCGRGLACRAIEADPEPRCRRVCATDVDCPLGRCIGTGNDRWCEGSACDPETPESCPPDRACRWSEVSALTGARTLDCLPFGSLADGAACASASDCVPGLACLGGTGDRRCTRLCDDASDCSAHDCAHVGDGAGAPLPVPGFCPRVCDVVTGAGCPTGQACRGGISLRVGGGLVVTPSCTPIGPRTLGQACDDANECVLGLSCDASGACYQPCVYPGGACMLGLCIPYEVGVLTQDGRAIGACTG